MTANSTGGRHVGVVGLAVMGENLALNIERNGFKPVVYNRTTARTEEFLNDRAKGKDIVGAKTIEEFVATLERPRRIILLVKAGAPVDAVIEELTPYLDQGDIVIDGGNSLFTDTERRSRELADKGFNFVGMGVSGGEEGALWGPSLMPGGPRESWDALEPMLTAIAAKSDFGACVTYIGPGGSGHYVKMVHNGIEYGDMELIAETYDVMRRTLGMTAPEIGKVFDRWNQGKLSSFLIEITGKVLEYVDPLTNKPLVDIILDKAAQKGTGRWTSQNSFELGTPIPVIDSAVIARSLSSFKDRRMEMSKIITGPGSKDQPFPATPDREKLIDALEDALYVAKITSYTQGMALLASASKTYDWNLNLSELARIWTAGCIIRAKLLQPIMEAFRETPDLANMMMAPYFSEAVNSGTPQLRHVISTAIGFGVPTPAMSAALNYIDTIRQPKLPADLIQGLRDYFGAH
ncbi:MAG TPA: NADP-dependent phosphogluconate dehydrogenase, partial [Thermomicrobiales bacterium]|nr:NADP-dependent phosphogluconate dehydrogenase [Thermomicrobiales bacterium]